MSESPPHRRNETFRRECSPLKVGGALLAAYMYEHLDGRRHVYFTPDGALQGSQVTRFGYRVHDTNEWGQVTQWLGMYVDNRLRGHHAGERIIEYWLEDGMEECLPTLGTGLIHKPLVALSLKRVGLTPENRAFQAEILPPSKYSLGHTPQVVVVKDDVAPEHKVTRSPAGRFYDTVPLAQAATKYPVYGSPVVALHTAYML